MHVRRPLRIAAAAACVAFAPAALAAQRVPALEGLEVSAVAALAEGAEPGIGMSGNVGLGYFQWPRLRTFVGVGYYVANIDREPGGDEGSFRTTSLAAGGRLDLFEGQRLAPFVRAGVTLQVVNADAADRGVGSLLEGTYTGALLGVGLRHMLTGDGRIGAILELRRTFITNVSAWSVELGARLTVRGTEAYVAEAPRIQSPEAIDVTRPAPARSAANPQVTDGAANRNAPDTAAARIAAERTASERRALEERTERERLAADETAERERAAAAARAADAAEGRLRQGLQRAVQSMASATGMRETADAFVVTISGTAFPSGSDVLSSTARPEVQVLATVLGGYPGHPIAVEGHTDAVGDAAANQVLSRARADAVRAALIVEGVDPLWTGARGWGSDRPVGDNATAQGRTENRRVEVIVARRPCDGLPIPDADGIPACPR